MIVEKHTKQGTRWKVIVEGGINSETGNLKRITRLLPTKRQAEQVEAKLKTELNGAPMSSART